jgi:hypothetical protein
MEILIENTASGSMEETKTLQMKGYGTIKEKILQRFALTIDMLLKTITNV